MGLSLALRLHKLKNDAADQGSLPKSQDKQEATNDSSYQTKAYEVRPAAKTTGIWDSNSGAA